MVTGVCAALVLAGGAAELWLLPRAINTPKRLKDSGPPTMTQPQLEAVMAQAAKSMDPQLREKLAEAILSESARNGYDPLFILALVAVESRFRISVSSDRGAYGLMQLKPSTFAWIAGREPDIGDDSAVMEDPVIDVRLAVRYFRWLERRFHSRDEALMAYNAGPKRLQQYKKTEIPESLREYPRRVMREYTRFVKLAGGGADPRSVVLARNN